DGKRGIVHVCRGLGPVADERLPQQEAAASLGELIPRDVRRCLRQASSELSQDPGGLDKAGGQHPRSRAPRPRAVGLTGAGCAELERSYRNAGEQRTLESEGDRMSGGQVGSDGLDQLEDLGAAAVPLNFSAAFAPRPAEVPLAN